MEAEFEPLDFSYLNELNDVQRQAVESTDGPTLIVAGPGSGKTRVLTYRIAHLLNLGNDPFRILALTFTNKAAEAMRHRIEQITDTNARSLYMGTFHSVFARILRVEAQRIGYPSNFTIYDTEDSKSLVKSIIREMNLDDKVYKPSVVFNRISSAKNSLIGPDQYAADPEILGDDRSSRKPDTHRIYRAYCDRCFKSGAMDFDDLLLKMHEILEQFPDALFRYQQKFKYVLIDEFQDTNPLQYGIVKRIAAVHENITVVGDDAQSIYAFRGATIDNILNFEKDFPDVKVFKLEQNYRSTKTIVKAANELIHRNKNQIKKEIWTSNHDGEPIRVVRTASDNEEGRFVADSIMELRMREHFHNRNFAVLYRTNAQSRSFEEALRRANIPYKVYGGVSFYQRKEVKDLLAYLKLTVNHHDEEALKRIINYPVRGIGQTSVDKAIIIAANQQRPVWDVLENISNHSDFNARTVNLITQFVMMIKSFRALAESKNAHELALHVGKVSGLVSELYNDKTVEGVSRFENLQELFNSIKEWVEDDVVTDAEMPSADRSLGAYLQNISLLTGDEKETQNYDAVKLMTVHSAKGLEFPVVYVGGLEENLFPSAQSMFSMEDLEEERRLFYVAITRAEKKLFLTWAATRYKFGQLNYCEPSRFMDELPEDILSVVGDIKKPKVHSTASGLLSRLPRQSHPTATVVGTSGEPFVPDDIAGLATGMKVIHEKFGEGKVVSMEGAGINRIAGIHFEGLGIKKIMLKFAKLKIAG